ncbi:MAG TPA: hypothetical protein DCY89_02340 [Gammaproteobacteria bacterium]|nr:hypothetical protein [Gammaproteobacteria bacterium]
MISRLRPLVAPLLRFYFRPSRLRVRLGEILIALVLVELGARWWLGLGTPPLYLPHPTIEYLLRPDQDIQRFGKHILVNHWAMRSQDFPARKTDPSEYRVLVVGDSIVNGTAVIDHAALATTRLGPLLAADLGRPVQVANISAGSWGPGNWLAYLRSYGLFDADLVLLVLSSHDAIDTPGYGPLDAKQYPVQAPILALEEGIHRYLERFVPAPLRIWQPPPGPPPPPPTEAELQALHTQALADLRALHELVQGSGAGFRALLHATQPELTAGLASAATAGDPGRAELKAFFAELGVPLHDLQPFWAAAIADGRKVYTDFIHLSAEGQSLLTELLRTEVRIDYNARSTDPP